ncbi:MAG: AEC family transporter, partial [Synergistaceae bacterium]|nr:AEC family transporter [Synergistaceae bacterium]
MNITILLTEQVIIFCIMMLCGFGLVKFKILKSSDSKILSIISVYIIIPCVIINAFQIQYSDEIRDGFLLAIIAAILIHIILFSLMRVTQIFFKFTSVETASIIYSNAGNLVIPLVMSVLGHDWVIYSSAFLAVQTVLMWSHCLAVMSRTKLNLKNFIKIFTNLNLICV